MFSAASLSTPQLAGKLSSCTWSTAQPGHSALHNLDRQQAIRCRVRDSIQKAEEGQGGSADRR